MDSILYHTEKYNLEIETVAKLLNTSIKESLKKEVTKLHLLKK